MQSEYDYLQVKITAILETTSPLHCGDGNTLLAQEWDSQKKKTDGTINTVCKGVNNQAYIPATTLRGSLRDRYKGNDKDILFGSSQGKGGMGKIRVYDATSNGIQDIKGDRYQHNEFKTILRDGVSINPVTQTAKEHHLFVHEIVPSKTEFTLILEVDRITKNQLENIIHLLQQWNNDMRSALGKGKSKGWGKLKLIKQPQIATLTSQAVKQWIEDQTEKPIWKSEESPSNPAKKQSNSIIFNLKPHSPLLINDHARITGVKQEAKQVFMRNSEGKAIIPGSSLKGAVRAHAHKIMATIAHLHYNKEAIQAAKMVENSINQLFGAEQKRSLLWISDAIDQVEGSSKKHEQYFNAVDRFTGGVVDTALFSVIAANCQQLSGECIYDNHPKRELKDDWWKGLLLLLVRDFMQGDFAIGWGKSKGYGQAKLTLKIADIEYQSFEDLLIYLNDEKADQWIDQLHQHIEQLVKESQQEEA
jgi:CRISPR/Cas system CSM-associated protein Csm3 (group 7 of RAMP superfamily)